MTTTHVSRPKTRRGHPQTNPNSLANLIPYQKGQNGHGRVYPLKERLQHLLDKPYTEFTETDKAKLKVGDVLAFSTMEGAILREPTPFKETWDRTEGKVPDRHQVDANIRQISVVEVVINAPER